MHARSKSAAFVFAGVLTFICGCFNLGHAPDQSIIETLRLGVTSGDLDLTQLGEPLATHTETTSTGTFVTRCYTNVRIDYGGIDGRILLLEFRDNNLNGFHYVSDVQKNAATIEVQKADTLRSGIGTFTRGDVLALLGRPCGKALSPSRLVTYRERCSINVTELWGWSIPHRQSSGFLITTDLLVGFAGVGRVSCVNLHDSAYELLRAF